MFNFFGVNVSLVIMASIRTVLQIYLFLHRKRRDSSELVRKAE